MHRWKLSALAAAAFVSFALTPNDAAALALGPIAVQSSLGEPLRAEIAVPQVSAAELEALRASIATPDIFRAQGMEYTPSARQIQVEVVRNPDGTAKLRLSSNGPVVDPFVDLVIDANWSSGHLVRSYTLLLDPPAAQRSAPAPVTAPQTTASARTPAPRPANVTGRNYSSDGAAPVAAAPATKDTVRAGSVTVRAGDTAGRLASAHRPAGVSLDQMLVAMQRNNPNAFINGNVNRLRAGSVVNMPSKEEASATSVAEARQIVAAQSRDFNEFRRRLATKVPDAKVAAAERSSSGQVQAQVQDNATPASSSDKLTLSKGALKGQHAAEEKLAQDKQASAQTERMGELQRNLDELKKVAASSSAAGTPPAAATPASAAQADTAPGIAVPAATPAAPPPVSEASPTPPPTATATPAAEAPAPDAAQAPSPAAAEPAKPVVAATPAAAPAVAEPGLLDELTGDNPLILPAIGGAIALLLGLVGWRTLQRRRQAATPAEETPNSLGATEGFFDDSGGQQIDTRQSTASGAQSTMAYSPSQLDAGGDVDPVAEAEVYLAYGRDVQAEEILKEALRTQPDRLGVHMKLAEIYAKRHDAKAFQATASAVQQLTHSTGPNWDRIVELGRAADPSNALYQQRASETPAAASSFADALSKSQSTPGAAATAMGVAGIAAGAGAAATASLSRFPADLDLNLDMDLPGGLADDVSADIAGPASVLMPSDQDFAALEPSWNEAPAASTPTATPATPAGPAFNPAPTPAPELLNVPEIASAATTHQPLDLNTLEFGLDEVSPPQSPVALQPLPVDEGFSLDLGDLDLDVGDTPAPAAPVIADDPLATKLDLAREFHAIGDSEGARTLVEEVIAEASGDLKARAQNLLAEIN